MILALYMLVLQARSADSVDAFNTALAGGDLIAADSAMDALLDSGATTGDVYFNLGNLRYRQGRLPEAMLAWRCAEARYPRDPDVQANLEFARRQLKSPSGVSPTHPAWAPWQAVVTPAEGQWIGAALLGLGWFVLAMSLGGPRSRPLGLRIPAWIAVILGVVIGAGAVVDGRMPGVGVVLTPATVTSDLGGGSDLFPLSPGSEVRILDSGGGQVLVGLADGRSGWLSAAVVAVADPEDGCRVRKTDASVVPAG